MARIYDDITRTIGNTPLVRLNRVTKDLGATVVAKVESFNPLSSIKDRIGVSMIEAAEQAGLIQEDTIIVEPTSGNTGIALAFVCAAKGYRLMLIMPETMSVERRRLLQALGAELVLTPGAEGMQPSRAPGRGARGAGLPLLHPAAVQEPGQPRDSPPHHRRRDLARHRRRGGYRGGGRRHRRHDHRRGRGDQGAQARAFQAIAVEPAASPVLSGGQPGPHKIQGIGAGFVPDVLRRDLLDEVVQVANEDAAAMARRLARKRACWSASPPAPPPSPHSRWLPGRRMRAS